MCKSKHEKIAIYPVCFLIGLIHFTCENDIRDSSRGGIETRVLIRRTCENDIRDAGRGGGRLQCREHGPVAPRHWVSLLPRLRSTFMRVRPTACALRPVRRLERWRAVVTWLELRFCSVGYYVGQRQPIANHNNIGVDSVNPGNPLLTTYLSTLSRISKG